MTEVLLALGLITLVGSLLRYLFLDLDVEAARRTIGMLVLNVFLPALVFRVICSVPTWPPGSARQPASAPLCTASERLAKGPCDTARGSAACGAMESCVAGQLEGPQPSM